MHTNTQKGAKAREGRRQFTPVSEENCFFNPPEDRLFIGNVYTAASSCCRYDKDIAEDVKQEAASVGKSLLLHQEIHCT